MWTSELKTSSLVQKTWSTETKLQQQLFPNSDNQKIKTVTRPVTWCAEEKVRQKRLFLNTWKRNCDYFSSM